MTAPPSTDTATDYDVVVLGAGIVGSAIARELAGYQLPRRAGRGPRRRRRRHQQGQHRHPAHRVRRQARARWSPGWSPAATTCCRDYADADRHPGRAHRRAAGRLERRGTRRAARPAGQGRRQRLHRTARSSTPTRSTGRCPHLGDGALGGLTVPDESIICTWTTNLALATDAVAPRRRAAHRAPGAESVDRRGRPHGPAHHRGRHHAPAGSSTPPASAPTTSTGCSATTGSPSPRAAASCSSSTSWRGRWSTRSCCRCPTSRGKGVLVSPTIYGNVMLGPTAEDLDDRSATGTSEAGFEFLLGKGRKLMPRPARRGGHRHLRRAARGHRPRRLPDRGRRRRSATSWSAASAPPG